MKTQPCASGATQRFSHVAFVVVYVLWNAQQVAGVSQSLDEALAGRPENFRILRAALEQHGLTTSLETYRGKTTIFAPTDDALASYFKSWGITEKQFLESPSHSVNCLLSFGMIGGEATDNVLRATLSQSQSRIYTSSGHQMMALMSTCSSTCSAKACWQAIIVHVDKHGKGSMQVGGSLVTSTDTPWKNGVIHVMDSVPAPVYWAPSSGRSLSGALSSRPNLGTFWAALQAAEADTALSQRAVKNRKYTIFAPTDEAFDKLLRAWAISKEDFLKGDPRRNVRSLLASLMVCGFGNIQDLWRGSALHGGNIRVPTFCPCDGSLNLQAAGHIGANTVLVEGAVLSEANQIMWLGGPIHVIDVVPHPPCWQTPPKQTYAATKQVDTGPPPEKVTTSLAPSVTTQAPARPHLEVGLFAAVSFCDPDLDSVLASHVGSQASLLRDTFQANGLGEKLETRPGRVTVFAPTDHALRQWMHKYGLKETDLFAPSWEVDDCVQQLFKNLIHTTELDYANLAKWVNMNGGNVELPTLCGGACGSGIQITNAGSNDAVLVASSQILKADISWCKGVVHMIDVMPVPEDWSHGTPSCKMKGTHGAAASKLQASLAARSANTGTTQHTVAEDSQLTTTWVAAVGGTLLASLLLCCVSAAYLRYLRGSLEAAPQGPSKLPALTEENVLTLETFKKKSNSFEFKKNGPVKVYPASDASTRCPSESSWDTCSVTSSIPQSSLVSTKSWRATAQAVASSRNLQNRWETSSQTSSQTSLSLSDSDTFRSGSGTPSIGATSCREIAVIGNTTQSNGMQLATTHYPVQPSLPNQPQYASDLATEGWEMIWSKSRSKYYYYNQKTGQSSWTLQSAPDAGMQTFGANSVHPGPAVPTAQHSSANRHSLRHAAKASHGRISHQPSFLNTVNECQQTA